MNGNNFQFEDFAFNAPTHNDIIDPSLLAAADQGELSTHLLARQGVPVTFGTSMASGGAASLGGQSANPHRATMEEGDPSRPSYLAPYHQPATSNSAVVRGIYPSRSYLSAPASNHSSNLHQAAPGERQSYNPYPVDPLTAHPRPYRDPSSFDPYFDTVDDDSFVHQSDQHFLGQPHNSHRDAPVPDQSLNSDPTTAIQGHLEPSRDPSGVDLFSDFIDDDAYAQEFQLDAFDQELLRRPYPQSHARLSLPPGPRRLPNKGLAAQQSHSRPSTPPAPPRLRDKSLAPQPRGKLVHTSRDGANTAPKHIPQQNLTLEPSNEDRTNHDAADEIQSSVISSPTLKASKRRRDMVHSKNPEASESEPEEDFTENQFASTSARRKQNKTRTRWSPRAIKDHWTIGGPMHIPRSPTPPVAQDIPLVSTTELPDRFKTVFRFPLFNAMQSKCFNQVFKSDGNFVLSSPTGSGKTAILEMAICRTISNDTNDEYKMIYLAPTKALCSERCKDWETKFRSLGLACVELTGDSDNSNLNNVRTANIIITTPEKWDSLTRKWKDHEKLMKMIKLFLIDEVHLLKESRGATLEVVVSRMKSIEADARFIALSATVPNLDDVAKWIGKNAAVPFQPAARAKFGEEFRPVQLEKHVCGYHVPVNDFSFDKFLEPKLLEVIPKYSKRKPIMIFCFTRASTVSTAKFLADWWSNRDTTGRYWAEPRTNAAFKNDDLNKCAACGVAFHHAGLDYADRVAVEKRYLLGDLNVICCTSTLAIGVNLPCHFVIIKNTVTYSDSQVTEYSDLEIMQMLGRAGRPQFDDSGVAVIMTRKSRERRYELMVSGQEVLESSLHLNLIEHLNAEIGLGTITNLSSAKKWLTGTFLFVRLKRNPNYYKLKEARSGQPLDDLIHDICNRDIALLRNTELVSEGDLLKCTEYGEAMARYYVQFDTMRLFVGLQHKAKISEILSALVQAAEFKEVRFRSGEKQFYKELNKLPSIRFPIPVNLDLPAHKVSLILQTVVGGTAIEWDGRNSKHRSQYNTDLVTVFRHVHRLIRCIIDCALSRSDSVTCQNALMLERSLGARSWDDSPLHMKQVEQIGTVAVTKLVSAGIRSLDDLENAEPHRIETILGRAPPFGMQLLDRLKTFPKLFVSAYIYPITDSKKNGGIEIKVKISFGFLNEKPVSRYRGKVIIVSLLVDTSDGRIAHFARISGQMLGKGQDVVTKVLIMRPDQTIHCYAMCDEIAGTLRQATLNPKIPAYFFPVTTPQVPASKRQPVQPSIMSSHASTTQTSNMVEEFDNGGIEDSDLLAVAEMSPETELEPTETAELENRKTACRHKCKNKSTCKHTCCREGITRPPKKSAVTTRPMKRASSIEVLDLTEEPKKQRTEATADIPQEPTEYQGPNLTFLEAMTEHPEEQHIPDDDEFSLSSLEFDFIFEPDNEAVSPNLEYIDLTTQDPVSAPEPLSALQAAEAEIEAALREEEEVAEHWFGDPATVEQNYQLALQLTSEMKEFMSEEFGDVVDME